MPDPIGGAYRDARDYWNDQALDYCETAHTVTAGALCDEPTVMSDACRAPSNRLDTSSAMTRRWPTSRPRSGGT